MRAIFLASITKVYIHTYMYIRSVFVIVISGTFPDRLLLPMSVAFLLSCELQNGHYCHQSIIAIYFGQHFPMATETEKSLVEKS